MVKAATAHNDSPSLESQRQLASYFRYPLSSTWPRIALLERPYWRCIAKVSVSHHSICGYHTYLAPTIKEELFCEWEIGIMQPWNSSVEIKFAVVNFVGFNLHRCNQWRKFLTVKISGITICFVKFCLHWNLSNQLYCNFQCAIWNGFHKSSHIFASNSEPFLLEW